MALRSQIDPFIKSFGYFMFNDDVFKICWYSNWNVLLMKGSNPPPLTAIHKIKLTIRRGIGGGGRF